MYYDILIHQSSIWKKLSPHMGIEPLNHYFDIFPFGLLKIYVVHKKTSSCLKFYFQLLMCEACYEELVYECHLHEFDMTDKILCIRQNNGQGFYSEFLLKVSMRFSTILLLLKVSLNFSTIFVSKSDTLWQKVTFKTLC